MPFGGRPSKGCTECRRRRIKCDQSRPGCMRCSRAGWECSGYRNELDLMFYDQSKDVVEKIRAGKDEDSTTGSSKSVHIPRSSGPIIPIFASVSTPETISTISSPSLGNSSRLSSSPRPETQPMPIEILARNYFMKNWASIGFALDPAGEFLVTETSVDAYSAIRDALGFVGLSFEHNAPEMMSKAADNYTVALKSLNKAVTDDKGAKQDRTLLAVVLMMVFELVTTMSGEMDPWWHHVLGAIAILRAHYPWRPEDQYWMRMFFQIRHFILHSCIIRGEAIPDIVVTLSENVYQCRESSMEPNCADQCLFAPMRRLCDLRAGVVSGHIVEAKEIFSTAQQIDTELEIWSRNLPQTWGYTTSLASDQTTKTDDSLHGYFHIYRDFINASQWNLYRIGRILANFIMLKYMTRDPLNMPMRQMCQLCQQQMEEEICASVPYLLDFEQTQREPYTKPRAAGGCLLLCPLAMVASLTDSEPIKTFVIQRLKYIGMECGVKRAYILHDLFTNPKKPGWSPSQLRLVETRLRCYKGKERME